MLAQQTNYFLSMETKDLLYICIPTIKSRTDRLEKCIQSIKDNVKIPYALVLYENERGGFVPAIHDILKGINGIVWCIGDDSIVIGDAVEKLWTIYNQTYPEKDGVVQPNDGIQGDSLITMPMCHSKIMQKYTYKGYNHWYADNEFTDIMKEQGKFTYVPDAKVDHIHWVNGKVPQDEKYLVSLRKNNEDAELYKKRKANNFEPKNDL